MKKERVAAVCACLSRMAANGKLEPEQAEAFRRATKELHHAVAVGDKRRVESTVDTICRLLLRVDHE